MESGTTCVGIGRRNDAIEIAACELGVAEIHPVQGGPAQISAPEVRPCSKVTVRLASRIQALVLQAGRRAD
jgi:hypothetical protein